MATQAIETETAARGPDGASRGEATPPADPVTGMRYVARQPILDLHSRVHGYELLFRNGPDLTFRGDGDLATRTMLDNTVIFGLERLTGGLPAFVNCTLESLTDNLVNVLPASMTVLEILENLEPTPDLIDACRRLKASGFRLALDDFVWRPEIQPLVELADYIKVDFAVNGAREREILLRQLRGATVALVAEKVETQTEFAGAVAEGFKLFQGYFFCRPVLMENRKVPVNRLSQIEILRELRTDSIDIPRLSQLVKRDASLTYRLLRLINSPVCAMRQEVRSIEAALIVVGEETFRRMATLAITSELNSGGPHELLRMAFVRARFCELAAGLCAADATEQYLVGLLSLLPAMLRLPMEELTPALPLREEIRLALLGAPIRERCLLEWVISHEYGKWTACDEIAREHGLSGADAVRFYGEAVLWAEAALHFVTY